LQKFWSKQTMNVAQYWADEANDAVHYDIAFSVLSTLELPILAEEDSEEEDEGKNAVNLPELPTNWEILDTLDLYIEANINSKQSGKKVDKKDNDSKVKK